MENFVLDDKNLFYIGGVVRDELLGCDSFDIDVTYQGNAIDFCKNLENNGICEIIQINDAFGTVKIKIGNRYIDVASTRNEIYEKKGHLPIVTEIGCELKKDVLRRDFSINALAKSVSAGEITDYTGGLSDLKEKKLRVLHDESFIDDPTRIIRGLKFAVRFNFELEEHTKQLQEEYLNNINYDMSYKRVKKELIETFNLNSQKAYEEFFKQNIYKLITEKEYKPVRFDIENIVKNNPVDNVWLVYLGDMDLSKLPLTKYEQKIIDEYKCLKEMVIENDDYVIYKAFENKPLESVLLYIINVSYEKGMRYLKIKDIKIFVNGNDLKELGILPSKKYSDCFDYILKNKLKNPKMSKFDELNLAKEYILSIS